MMTMMRGLAALGASMTLVACAAGTPPGPVGTITPGPGKTEAAYQQDQAVCQQHAVAGTGYGGPSTPAPTPPPAAAPPASATPSASPGEPSGDANFMQCMAARRNTVRLAAAAVMPGYVYP